MKFTRAEKKQIEALQAKARNERRKPYSAQETIDYKTMYPDGVCHVKDNIYSKTIEFQDINYAQAQEEDKEAIVSAWCNFLNSFDPSVNFQFSFINMATSVEDFERSVMIPLQGDEFDEIREEYTAMLRSQLAKGNNSLTKRKYLTFSIKAGSIKTARPKLERLEISLLSELKRVGVPAQPIDGKERLRVMHSIFHMGMQERMQFEWNWLVPSGLSTKDFIAPSSFDFRPSSCFKMGDKWACASMMQIYTQELDDDLLRNLLEIEANFVVSMHVHSIDQVEALKKLRHMITDLDKMTIEEQKKAVRAGYDMDILPGGLKEMGTDAKTQKLALERQNERMFMMTFLILHTADSQRELRNIFFSTRSLFQQQGNKLVKLDFQQEQGLISSLPLGVNQIQVERNHTTRSLGNFIPFMTRELFQHGNDVLYYGLNMLSGNLIMADRKRTKNPNGMIFGTPGSGKSFAAKREVVNCFLATKDDIMICDPEGEYYALVQRLKGQVIRISPNSTDYINPLDISFETLQPDAAIRLKSDFVLSLCELVVGSKNGIEGIDRTVIDRTIPLIYQAYIDDPRPENMPTLGDLHRVLLAQNEKEAHRIATVLEIYVTGSLNVFNHRTNVDVQNRLVCYDIKELGTQLKKLGMLIVQDQVWSRVSANRAKAKTTRYYIDEFHLLLKEPETAAYSVEMWKRFRKWGGIPTGITQNVKDLLASREIENIFENSDFIYMLNQAPGDREILARHLGISDDQLSNVTNSMEGQGLLFYGDVIIPFIDRFPTDNQLYSIMTTKPGEVHHQEVFHEEE